MRIRLNRAMGRHRAGTTHDVSEATAARLLKRGAAQVETEPGTGTAQEPVEEPSERPKKRGPGRPRKTPQVDDGSKSAPSGGGTFPDGPTEGTEPHQQ